ncbi:beta-ketoacyl synthase, N-terminal domain protein [Mycobacterium kansasii]|uniref:Beta-ketoacyl synthase, N-terminal domain protein n=1 Tax=Mycobacterium kansasii TaxID=1768 RepID=A0A1V3XMS9_MYCKA|nr:beta-ketoacyl synthase, N-terminal domain protein [Mycobacterium kansasii]
MPADVMIDAAGDHVVISGMAVEAPGGIDSPGALWSALSESRELLGPFPRDRGWPIDELLSLSRRDSWAGCATPADSSMAQRHSTRPSSASPIARPW